MSMKRVVAIASVFAAVCVHADMTVEQKVVTPSPTGGQMGESTVIQRIKGKKMRMDIDKMTSSLVDLDGKMYIIEHKAKGYGMPLDVMAKQAGTMMAMFAAGGKTPPHQSLQLATKKPLPALTARIQSCLFRPMQITATGFPKDAGSMNLSHSSNIPAT